MPIPQHVRRYQERSSVINADERKRRASHPQASTSYTEAVKLLKVSQMRRAIYDVIRPGVRTDSQSGRLYDSFIVAVVFLSMLPLMFKGSHPALSAVEHVTVYIIFMDYMLRWITADLFEGREGKGPFFRYPFRPLAIMQLVGMLPAMGALPAGYDFLTVARIGVCFYYIADLFYAGGVLRNWGRALGSVVVLVAGYILVAGTILYACEPDTFGNFIDAIYWAVTSFTTVGYGDLYPHSYIGKVIASITMFVGLFVIAIPTAIVTAGYLYEVRKQREQGSYYVRPRSLKESIIQLQEEGGLRVYLRRHQALVRYLLVMFLCLGIDVLLITFANVTGLPLWLDTMGTALASVLLETGAGIIVGLGSNICLAIEHSDPSLLLYYVVPASTALAYGLSFQRGRPITVRKMVRVVVLIVVVATVWDVFLAYLLYDGIPSGAGERMLYYLLTSNQLPALLAKFGAIFIIEAVDKVITALFVGLFINIAPDSWRRIALPPKAYRGPDLFAEGWFLR